MTAVADILRNTDPDSRAEVLDRLTHTHAEMMERHGPMLGMEGVPPPAGAKTFAAEQSRLAALQDAATDPVRIMDLMLERTAREHDQIGRLSVVITSSSDVLRRWLLRHATNATLTIHPEGRPESQAVQPVETSTRSCVSSS